MALGIPLSILPSVPPPQNAQLVRQDSVSAADDSSVVREFRYRLQGAVRPLLFWMGDDDVGGALIVRHDDAHGSVYEFLVGTDPTRAPRSLNRWGWVREERRDDGATQMGVMSKVEEATLSEVEAKLDSESMYAFKAIRTEIVEEHARASNTVWLVPDNYTYYDLGAVRRIIEGTPAIPPKVNEGRIPAGTHPGLLFAVDELMERAVAAATREPRELLRDATTTFNFNAVVCDMRLKKTEWEESKEYGDRRYQALIRMEFETYDPSLRKTDHFTIVCGTRGTLKGVPVYMKFQPKWWFRSECVLDESQVFKKGGENALRSDNERGGARSTLGSSGVARAPDRTQGM